MVDPPSELGRLVGCGWIDHGWTGHRHQACAQDLSREQAVEWALERHYGVQIARLNRDLAELGKTNGVQWAHCLPWR